MGKCKFCSFEFHTQREWAKHYASSHNPTKNPEIAKKISRRLREYYKITPFPCSRKGTHATKEQIERNKERAKYAHAREIGFASPDAREKARRSLLALHRHCSKETKRKISVSNTGKKRSAEAKKRISEAKKGFTPSYEDHKEWVEGTKDHLEREGYRTIVIKQPLPDLIAFKDDKVYAVEVDDGFPLCTLSKYETPHDYNDILWILIQKEKKIK